MPLKKRGKGAGFCLIAQAPDERIGMALNPFATLHKQKPLFCGLQNGAGAPRRLFQPML